MAALAVVVAACGDTTGSDTGRIALRFGTVPLSGASTSIDGAALSVAADELTITGSNGTLEIEDIQLIVSEVELKRLDDAECEGDDDDRQGVQQDVRLDERRGDDDEDEEECEEFEGGPFLVDLPLGGGEVTVLEEEIPAGTFTAIEFEIEDFEMEDDDDDGEGRRANQLLAQLRTLYPNVPPGANMVVKGTFTPTTGPARPFIVYFNADVEIKERFPEPLLVDEGGGITVRIDPSKWFLSGTQVRDLSRLDGQLVEFELEMKRGFIKIECEKD